MSANLGDLINLNRDLDKVAIIDQTSRRVTYKELDNMANWAAVDLKNKGFGYGDRIAIRGTNSISYIAAYLGILKLGAVAVLINVKLPQEQVDYIVKDSDVKYIWESPSISFGVVASFESYNVNEADPAIVMYTSGSTSRPKGVILPHKHKWIINYKSNYATAAHRRAIVAAPLYHMNGLSNTETTLCGHGTLILLEKFDAVKFLAKIAFHRVNSITSVPTMLSLLLEETDLLQVLNLSCVSHISMASAPVSKNLFDRLKIVFPNASITNNYGITEVSPGMFGKHPTLPTPELSVGYPLLGIDYRIVDGILQVRSPAMFLKYNNVTLNNVTDDGYFITNDLFRIDENGFYFFLGRADDMFVCGGNNIYPRQIESILEDFPGVVNAAVIGLEDDIKGMKPYAFVVSNTATEEKLLNHIQKLLPPSHYPRKIWIIDKMPLNSVNKIDKAVLKEKAKNELNG
jgi:acyl-CoA synthetase (AMP-forming)/AMP-acid ligase II